MFNTRVAAPLTHKLRGCEWQQCRERRRDDSPREATMRQMKERVAPFTAAADLSAFVSCCVRTHQGPVPPANCPQRTLTARNAQGSLLTGFGKNKMSKRDKRGQQFKAIKYTYQRNRTPRGGWECAAPLRLHASSWSVVSQNGSPPWTASKMSRIPSAVVVRNA